MNFRQLFTVLLVAGIAILTTGCAGRGYVFVPKNTGAPVNVLAEEERLSKIAKSCDDMVDAAEPADYPADIQFWNRAGWGTVGAFGLYGITCLFPATAYMCPMFIPMALGYTGVFVATSTGDRIADEPRGEDWHATQCVKELDGGRNIIMPSKKIPEGEARMLRKKAPVQEEWLILPSDNTRAVPPPPR